MAERWTPDGWRRKPILQVPQYINRIVTVRSKKVNNFTNGLLATPKFHEVWIEA